MALEAHTFIKGYEERFLPIQCCDSAALLVSTEVDGGIGSRTLGTPAIARVRVGMKRQRRDRTKCSWRQMATSKSIQLSRNKVVSVLTQPEFANFN